MGKLDKYKRIAIVGGPKTGKTTLASSLNRPVVHTDDFNDTNWSQVPKAIIDKSAGEYLVIEGVQAARALRKGLQVDAVVYIAKPKMIRTSRQEGMSKSVDKWFNDWRHEDGGKTPVVYDVEVEDWEE